MKKFAVAVALAGVSAVALATPQFNITNSTGTIGIPNDPAGWPINNLAADLAGLGYSATGWATTPVITVSNTDPTYGGQYEVTYQLLGYEVGLASTFAAGSGSFSSVPTTNSGVWLGNAGPTTTETLSSAGGELSFVFTQGPGFTSLRTLVGNSALTNDCSSTVACLGPNFLAKIGGSPAEMIILFDDDGSLSSDNHDDMAVRITVREVPVPATLPLLGLGLIGLAAARRRKAA